MSVCLELQRYTLRGFLGLVLISKKYRHGLPSGKLRLHMAPQTNSLCPSSTPKLAPVSAGDSRNLLAGLPFSSIAQVPSMLHTVLQSDKKEIGLICSSSFRCIAKLSIKYREFQCVPCTPTCPASCTLNILHRGGHLWQLMNLHWHYCYPELIVSIWAHSWCCAFCRFGQMHDDMWHHAE